MPLKDPEALRAYQKQYRQRNAEKKRAYDREYARENNEAAKVRHELWRNKPGNMAKITERNKRYREQNELKHAAHNAVQCALIAGTLTKQPCEVCEATNVDAHHDDYSQPLIVRWLCRKHHRLFHRHHA